MMTSTLMNLFDIHPLTARALDERLDFVVKAFAAEIDSQDPAYFAPFLRQLGNRRLLQEWIAELASWEWALHFAKEAHSDASAQVLIDQRSDAATIAPTETLSFVILKWDVMSWLKSQQPPARRDQLLKVWFDTRSKVVEVEEVSMSEAHVFDVLREGPLPLEELSIQISSRGVPIDLVESLIDRGLLISISRK